MADIDGDEGFLDDDLDALISQDFLELQRRAIHSTQQQKPTAPAAHGLQDISHTRPVGLVRRSPRGVINRNSRPLAQAYTDNPSSDYGDLDDEVLDAGLLDVQRDPVHTDFVDAAGHRLQGESTQREQWRHQRYSGPPNLLRPDQPQSALQGQYSHIIPIGNRKVLAEGIGSDDEKEMLDVPEQFDEPVVGVNAKPVDELHAKIAELLRERETLNDAVQSAHEQAFAKAGEISIVRANQLKTQRDHERQLKEVHKQHSEIAARQQAEIEHARAEREKLVTEKKYLQHDLIEESERARQLQRIADSGIGSNTISKRGASKNAATTPNKNVALPFRDGFDDDEIMTVSPSKTSGRFKAATPKAGEKRKRKVAEPSPAQSLQFGQPKDETTQNESTPSKPQEQAAKGTRSIPRADYQFQYTQKVLNHRVGLGERRSFEALADFAFPSAPKVHLSTLLLDKMTLLSANQNMDDFLAALVSIVISLWSCCIKEEYYEPLRLLLDLVKFILLSNSTVGPQVMDEVIELAQKTADINVIPRFKRFTAAAAKEPKKELNDNIDTNECLQILYLIALACIRRKEDIARFWRFMRFDFIMMMFRTSQPVEDIQLMLKLLETSVQENTFAMITNSATQIESEQHIIDRVSLMLIDVPKAAEGEQPYDAVEIAEMRIQVLSFVEKLCDKRHGGEAFAKHPLATGRLVRVMNHELNALYDHKFGHEYRAELVNQATRLLFHLTSAYPNIINMQEKLRAHPGGVYKHLIVLTRLAFSDGLFFERGIEDDVVDCAHQMLEDTVTPEEGEALLEVFSTAKK
ncbi:hypothetical protein MMC17_004285 [Xylographa soralifera]|nr:hypothetical protein [Xylographa soralifera]